MFPSLQHDSFVLKEVNFPMSTLIKFCICIAPAMWVRLCQEEHQITVQRFTCVPILYIYIIIWLVKCLPKFNESVFNVWWQSWLQMISKSNGIMWVNTNSFLPSVQCTWNILKIKSPWRTYYSIHISSWK